MLKRDVVLEQGEISLGAGSLYVIEVPWYKEIEYSASDQGVTCIWLLLYMVLAIIFYSCSLTLLTRNDYSNLEDV